jgi:hypothetical protein
VSCRNPLEPAQELRFLVETSNLDNPEYLARIRRLPARNGKPLPVCKRCQTLAETAPTPARPQPTANPIHVGLLAVAALLSLDWLFKTLGSQTRT